MQESTKIFTEADGACQLDSDSGVPTSTEETTATDLHECKHLCAINAACTAYQWT